MKNIFTLLLIFIITQQSFAQQIYNDFEGNKVVSLAEWNGVMDSTSVNPNPNAINSSSLCAKYIRDTTLYDNFKFFPYSKLTDVTTYASSSSLLKITMKLYTNAPIGTKVDLQLGSRTNTTYPAGVHSEYQATVTAQGAWQLLTFNFIKVPTGSTVSPTDIDKIVVFFNAGANTKDTIYFDDPSGPQLSVIGLKENINTTQFKLYQNKPNPVKDNASIKLQLNSPGYVSLKLYDILGKPISILADQNMNEGLHSIPVNTENIPSGVYFYVLKKGNTSQTMKMIISK